MQEHRALGSTVWVNKSPLNLAALLVDLQRKKRINKTLRCLVYGLQLSSRNPPSWLYVVNSLLILSNISRNICSFLFFLCRQCVPPHPQLVPPQEFHVHALENKNHPPSPHVLIHRREASDTTSSNQHCTSRARTRPLPPLLPRGTDPQPESKALQRKGMWKEQAKIRERTGRTGRREARGGKGANENSAMKTWVKARMKSRNLISLVVFIVDKETNSVHQVNYSVNSSIFFSCSFCDQVNSCSNIARTMTTFITLEVSKRSLFDWLL